MSRLWASWTDLGLVVVATVGIYGAVILYTKVAGLRSLATMSSFDFAAVLYLLQAVVPLLRRAGGTRAVDNAPLLLMAGTEVVPENLAQARVTEAELMAQVRAAGVTGLAEVQAVVMESTGSISVLAGDGGLDAAVLSGVRDADRALTSDRS